VQHPFWEQRGCVRSEDLPDCHESFANPFFSLMSRIMKHFIGSHFAVECNVEALKEMLSERSRLLHNIGETAYRQRLIDIVTPLTGKLCRFATKALP
jgi:hypothetical protein